MSQDELVGVRCTCQRGILEKKTSYDFGEVYRNDVHYIGRREREMLLARAAILLPCLVFALDPATAIIAVAVVLVGNIGVIAATRLFVRDPVQANPPIW